MSSTEIGGRMPTSSALSDGTASVRSPCATFSTRYSFFSPKTSRISLRSITAAPWWGYTTRSPTLNDMPLHEYYEDAARTAKTLHDTRGIAAVHDVVSAARFALIHALTTGAKFAGLYAYSSDANSMFTPYLIT